MAYKIIMDNLLAEFRAVQKIQAQDAQVIKQLSNEEKARLSLVQKLIKAYLAGEPEEVVLGLLGGNGLAVQVANRPSTCGTWPTDCEAAWQNLQNRARLLCNRRDDGQRATMRDIRQRIADLRNLRVEVNNFSATRLLLRPVDCIQNLPISQADIDRLDEELVKWENIYEQFRQMNPKNVATLNSTMDGVSTRLNTLQAPRGAGETDAEFRERNTQARILATFNTELEAALTHSPVIFSQNATGGNELRMTPRGLPIVITNGDLEMRAHELQHFIQYTKGKLAFVTLKDPSNPNPNRGTWSGIYDISDELQAYRVQFIVNPATMPFMANDQRPTRLADITSGYVRQIRSGGQFIYQNLPDGPFSMETLVGNINAATRGALTANLFEIARNVNAKLTVTQFETGINAIPDINGLSIRSLLSRTFRFNIGKRILDINYRDYIIFK